MLTPISLARAKVVTPRRIGKTKVRGQRQSLSMFLNVVYLIILVNIIIVLIIVANILKVQA